MTAEEASVERAKDPISVDVLSDIVSKWDRGSKFIAVWTQVGDPFVYGHHGTVKTRKRDGTG